MSVPDAAVPDAGSLVLEQYPETLAVVRLGPGSEVPAWAESSSVFSVTATATETSVVCASRSVPTKARQYRPWTAFAVQGPLDRGSAGVLVDLLRPLSDLGMPVVTVGTFETDWILVPRDRAGEAGEEWRRSGHTVRPAVPVPPRGDRP